MIRVPEVRVIDHEGEQLGILPTAEALAKAEDLGLDLVEISPTTRPPVCRIMDFGKYKYELSKKQRESKKKQHTVQVKEVKLRPKTEEHDYQFKKRHAEEFLEKYHKVKLTIMFRGRELAHKERGAQMLDRMVEDLSHVGSVESPPRFEGRTMVMYMAPLTRPKTSGQRSKSRAKEGKHAKDEKQPSSDEAVSQDGDREDSSQSRVHEPHTHKENDQA